MAVGVGVKSELKDFGELRTYFNGKGVPIQESEMRILLFKNPFKNKNDPLIDEMRKDLEKKYEGITVQPRTSADGQVYGFTIWQDIKRV